MGEIKIGDKVLVEMNVVGWDKITGDYQMRPKEDTRTFWASKETVYPVPTKTYEDGLREAWETARLIEMEKASGGLEVGVLSSIFGTTITPYIFRDNTAQEAAAKIAEWEKKQEIRVGDVVKDTINNRTAVVSYAYNYDSKCYVIWGDGSSGKFEKNDFVKTGRTIDIAGLLAQIGGTE